MRTNTIKQTVLSALGILVVSLSLAGCQKKEPSIPPSSTETSSSEQTNTERKILPFTFDGRCRLTTNGDFSPDASGNFRPTQLTHPIGSLEELTCDGVAIELASEEIQDGKIITKEFGEIEIFNGPNGIEFHGTSRQRKALEQYVKKHLLEKTGEKE